MSERPAPTDDRLEGDAIRRRTRRAFGWMLAGGLAAGAAWWWLRSTDDADGLPWPLRRFHQFNESLGRRLFSSRNLAPEFPSSAAGDPRINGGIGMPAVTDPATWKVSVVIADRPPQALSIADLLADVPRIESTTELKCIEGWSQVVRWGGVRFADVARHHGWPLEMLGYAGLSTPDGGYYVGLDLPGVLHPQTLLCDRMNGSPLSAEHGGPLRLVIPVKYGIKNLKWLARIVLTSDRPADYWAERGYDWYAGL